MDLVLGNPPVGLRRPVLLAGFGGWGDAGSAATIALRHLLGDHDPTASAMVDPSACYDFTVARPLSSRSGDGRRWSLEYPKVAFYPVRLPMAERDLLLVVGPEPHFRWPHLAPAMIAYAQSAEVGTIITLGAFVGPVSHRNAPIMARALDNALESQAKDLGIGDTGYEGPTAFVTALLHAGAAANIPSASLWVATPPYLQAGNPVAALALLEAAASLTRLPLDATRLRDVAQTFLHEVDTALEEHPELAEQLKEMLEAHELEGDPEQSDTATIWRVNDPDRPPPDAPPGLPSGKSLVEAVERYLRQARGEEDETKE